MPYIGSSASPLPVNFAAVQAQSFSGTGSQTAFTLNRTIPGITAIEVLVNNVQQSPYDGSYSVAGTTLTFSEAPSAGTNNVYVVYRDQPVGSLVDESAYRKAEAVAKAGDTMTGALALPAGGLNVGSGQLAVDASGRVTMSAQPAFAASCSSNTTYNASSFTSVLIYNSASINTGSHYNTSSGLFTAPVSGWYEIFAGAYINTSDAGQIWTVINGVRAITMDVKAALTNDTISGGGIFYLSANDTLGVHAYSPSGGTKTLLANEYHTFFRGILIG